MPASQFQNNWFCRKKNPLKAVHPPSISLFLHLVNSQLQPRDPAAHGLCTYRCYLPVLTGLGTLPLRRAWFINAAYSGRHKNEQTSEWEFHPAIADCRLQGTASSPSSTAVFVELMGFEPTACTLRTYRSPI
jgi:hypothetical protein